MRADRGRLRSSEGVVATEFALLIPIFLALVFGMVWVGTSFFRSLNLESAAREGARFAAILPTGYFSDDTDGVPDTAWFLAVADRVQDASAAPTQVCVAYLGLLANQEADDTGATTNLRYLRRMDGTTEGPLAGSCYDDGRAAERRRVQVQTAGEIPFAGFGFFEGLLGGDATARFEAVYPAD